MKYKPPQTYLVHEYGIPVRVPVRVAETVGLLRPWQSTYRTVEMEPDDRRALITQAVALMDVEAGR